MSHVCDSDGNDMRLLVNKTCLDQINRGQQYDFHGLCPPQGFGVKKIDRALWVPVLEFQHGGVGVAESAVIVKECTSRTNNRTYMKIVARR